MKTIDTQNLVTATGGFCGPRGYYPAPAAYMPYYGRPVAPRWAYAPAYAPAAFAPRGWGPPRGWWY